MIIISVFIYFMFRRCRGICVCVCLKHHITCSVESYGLNCAIYPHYIHTSYVKCLTSNVTVFEERTFILMCVLVSHVQLFVTAWTVASQAPLSMGFSRQKYWSVLPFSSPADLPTPGIEPWSPTRQVNSLPSTPPLVNKIK